MQVTGFYETLLRGKMKVKACCLACLGRTPAVMAGCTTGPSELQRKQGGARAYTLGPERW